MLRVIQCGVLAWAVWASPAVSFASLIQYTITVEVTAAGVAPGSFPSNPWSFSSVPATFVGTFDADDTVVGGISNLALTIGGLDIATSHPVAVINSFDPNTLLLSWFHADPSFSFIDAESGVLFGALGDGVPSNYAVAVQDSSFDPNDPFYMSTQNWVGTYAVAPSAVVPEPASLTLIGLGAFGLVAGAIRRRRQPQA